MENKTLGDLVYEKIKAEYDHFINDLKTKPPSDIVEAAYEIVYKDDILSRFEWEDFLDEEEYSEILKLDNALEYFYNAWLDSDGTDSSYLTDSIRYATTKLLDI